jgi:DNA-binding transcriptional LysR family regulator
MNKFESISAFTMVVDHGGFAAAGRVLGVSRSAVSKAVSQLEDSLGAQLLNRSTRQVSPTEMGIAYYDRCVTILAELEEADLAVSRLQEEPRGTLRINAPMAFGTLHLGSAIAAFMARYPDIRIQLTLNDRYIDPIEEGFDVTVRIGDLTDSSLIARKIAPARRVICAAPSYLAAHGTPASPRDLRFHRCMHYGYLATGNHWRFSGPDGDHLVPVDGILCSNNGQVLRDGAVGG